MRKHLPTEFADAARSKNLEGCNLGVACSRTLLLRCASERMKINFMSAASKLGVARLACKAPSVSEAMKADGCQPTFTAAARNDGGSLQIPCQQCWHKRQCQVRSSALALELILRLLASTRE